MTTINASTRLLAKSGVGEIRYPLYLSDVRLENIQWSFPSEPEIEFIKSLGYEVVHPVTSPLVGLGFSVTEGVPVQGEDGLWKQVWISREHTPEELQAHLDALRAEKSAEVGRLLATALEKGFSFQFDDGSVGHVQIRDGDRTNHAGMRVRAGDYIAAGQDTAIMPFRDWENVTHECLPEEIVRLSIASYDAYLGFLAIAWGLKDRTDKAITYEDLPELPAEISLPVFQRA